MKTYILLVTLQIIIFCHWSSASSTGLEQRKSSAIVNLITRRLRHVWAWIWNKEDQDDLMGRCFGVARRLKFAMPMIVFKLGVIVTILAFLTIFSLKSLGLLLLLLMLHSSGIAAKWTHMKYASSKQWTQPQNVHFHLHSKDHAKEGHYVSHSEYGHPWYEKNDVGDTEYESLEDRLKKLNIYDSHYRKLFCRYFYLNIH
ncbi:cuticular protein analogous to peritrophins 1-E isoform X1 [Tribolium castaneum]